MAEVAVVAAAADPARCEAAGFAQPRLSSSAGSRDRTIRLNMFELHIMNYNEIYIYIYSYISVHLVTG